MFWHTILNCVLIIIYSSKGDIFVIINSVLFVVMERIWWLISRLNVENIFFNRSINPRGIRYFRVVDAQLYHVRKSKIFRSCNLRQILGLFVGWYIILPWHVDSRRQLSLRNSISTVGKLSFLRKTRFSSTAGLLGFSILFQWCRTRSC